MTTRTPIWKSICSALSSDIADGRYGSGDKLPTEAQLASRFGVNRHTVRHALKVMAEEGLVLARRGAGVFVAQRPTEYQIGRRVRFHQNLEAAGRMPAKEILLLETRKANARETETLQLIGSEVHVYEGLSLSDGQPIGVFRSVFPADRFPNLLENLRKARSVTKALQAHGVTDFTRSQTSLTAKTASATIALHLRLSEGAPILRAVSVNVDPEGRPIEYGRTWFAGDRVTLTVKGD
ncbi:phosphonate metabolism transcriptional regulator PhnF [Parasedimentitalea huanghaiensis]|uniref:Phosphonate metabolism transcriptional regulator PhnF n=1 Tax=Parasedimentitalea huanghaiensis TaxID=2682100 RepID=A0A6L6WFB4_9RHOB|nr:phosphonate metabolism transcriptional regulator PhnF [Zongyanglinia huanghaiensis]MVO14352.1 phosphonate metabolism transcriptional regulator PhnF [Zongyanglinia huanghaiensis]